MTGVSRALPAVALVVAAGASIPSAFAQDAASAAATSTGAIEAGRQLYSKNCSHCHGFNMVNPGTVSFDLRKFPHGDPERFYTSVLEGKGAMPSWKQSLTRDQVDAVWAYVQTGGRQ